MSSIGQYILMLEDDDDDRHITETFFAASDFDYGIEFLTNSDEVMPFLESRRSSGQQLPSLILLDKNVPANGGMEVLKNIKSNSLFKIIPVVMISGSPYQSEINESYRLGVNSFIAKPYSSELTAQTIQNFIQYWFSSVQLPETATISANAI